MFNFFNQHSDLNTWIRCVVLATLLLALNFTAAFMNDFNFLSVFNYAFSALWVGVLIFQFRNKPTKPKAWHGINLD